VPSEGLGVDVADLDAARLVEEAAQHSVSLDQLNMQHEPVAGGTCHVVCESAVGGRGARLDANLLNVSAFW
jgi:hypothetical protein